MGDLPPQPRPSGRPRLTHLEDPELTSAQDPALKPDREDRGEPTQ